MYNYLEILTTPCHCALGSLFTFYSPLKEGFMLLWLANKLPGNPRQCTTCPIVHQFGSGQSYPLLPPTRTL